MQGVASSNPAVPTSVYAGLAVKRVVSALPKENRQVLAASVIKRLGQATAGNQNELGNTFSTHTFLTNWNKLSAAAKQTLFGRVGQNDLLEKLGNLAHVSSTIKAGSKVFANPSGTSAANLLHFLTGGGLMSLATGNLHSLLGIASVPIGAKLGAKFMTSPNRLLELMQPSKFSSQSVPSTVNALAQLLQNQKE